MTEPLPLAAAIAALDAQRALLGDAVVDAALAPMREQLARLTSPVPGAPPEQALRQVSVLFLDVVGSTALSQRLDPEEVHAVMDGALERCTAVVVAQGGQVLQYAGDNLLAAFGARQAREDDSERAVHCGLALLEEGRALGERVLRDHGQAGCDVRVGIHTGPVLLGGGVDEEGTIRGLTVNVAARMEQTAPPGALRISHDTWLLVRGVFDVEAQPPLKVKGRDDALVTYLVQRAKPRAFRVRSRGVDGVLPPMVGREAELQRLVAMIDEVATQRSLRAATVVAEPGLGKSRLLHELQNALEVHPQRFWLLLGRAHPGSRLEAYGLLRSLLTWRLQIADSDSSEQAKAKLVDGLLPWLGDRAEAKAHGIGQIIGLDFTASPHVRGMEPQLLRRQAFAALHDYFQGLAGDGGVIALLVEDLHWADDGSLDFIAGLASLTAPLPLLLVATARPELLERRPSWGEGGGAHQAHQKLHLTALDTAQAEHLARALLHRVADGADGLRQVLIAQADGNPFYMEELLRMFIDDGVVALEGDGGGGGDGDRGREGATWRVQPDKLRRARIPTTLVGVLQARLDALPAADRLALQQASIVGHVFWDQALAAIDPQATAAVPNLQGRSLIHRRDSSAFEGTLEESFHHHLLQQVTYDTVLKPARRAGHAAAAQWLADRVGDRPAEYLAITGEHYERAGDHRRALDYITRAAKDAIDRFANQTALEYVERALRNPAATDLRQRYLLYFYQCSLADMMGLRSLNEAALQQTHDLAEALDDDALRADVMMDRALLASRRGDENGALELARQTTVLAGRSGNVESGALAWGQIAWSCYSRGEVAVALGHVEVAIESLRGLMRRQSSSKAPLLEVQTLTLRAIIESATGDIGRARGTLTEALGLARERGMRRPQTSMLESLGNLEMNAGRFAEALACYEASTALASEIGWVIYVAMGRLLTARCLFAMGEAERAAGMVALAEADALRCESREAQARCQMLRGRLAAAAGPAGDAGAGGFFARAVAIYESLEATASAGLVRAYAALWHLDRGRLADALASTEAVAADLAAGVSFAATEEAMLPRFACHRVWAAAGDARATAMIATAHAELQALVMRNADAGVRNSMLNNIAVHGEIVAAWEAHGRP